MTLFLLTLTACGHCPPGYTCEPACPEGLRCVTDTGGAGEDSSESTVDPSDSEDSDAENPVDTDDPDTSTESGLDSDSPVHDFCSRSLGALLPVPGTHPLGTCVSGEIAPPALPGMSPSVEEWTNEFGSTSFNKEMYSGWHCASTEASSAHYNAPERSFTYTQPPHSEVWVKLDKECSRNLEMRILRRPQGVACPQDGDSAVFCERDASSGTSGDQLHKLVAAEHHVYWTIIVDGRNDTMANFRISLECRAGQCSDLPL